MYDNFLLKIESNNNSLVNNDYLMKIKFKKLLSKEKNAILFY